MDQPISVAIEASALMGRARTGIQVYTENLLRELIQRPDDVCVRMLYRAKPFKDIKPLFADFPGARSYLHSLTANVGDARITHSTDNKFLYKRQCANIATVYDVAIFLPENDVPGYTTPEFRSRQFILYGRMMEKADVVLTISESTKSDISRLFPVEPDKIRVVYPGIDSLKPSGKPVDEGAILKSYDLQHEKYLLFVGAISIRKNLLNLVEAFAKSKVKDELKLVLVGPMSMGSDEIIGRVKNLDLERSVVFTSYVSDDDLAALYRNAKAFVFPTYYEGFGMPILEAMSFGLPVLIGNRGAAPEIADGLAVEVDPFSVDGIERGLSKVVETNFDRPRLASHAAKYNWDRCGREIIALYGELAG